MKNTPPPNDLDVLGKIWRVLWVKNKFSSVPYGETRFTDCEIRIYKKAALQQRQDTLIHEAIHAIDDSLALGLTEQQVHGLAAALYDVLRRNPIFTLWLMS